ncbi:Uncharacterised protein [Staphylococcus petrasii]|uniref:Uncharacterized protein n=1 Tax=Staphylococcus petrasii TaxID=1276936 RepID=A0A380FZ20_9STAP|nr:Uncharacterised protein [Staphylococcus petrasii]
MKQEGVYFMILDNVNPEDLFPTEKKGTFSVRYD